VVFTDVLALPASVTHRNSSHETKDDR